MRKLKQACIHNMKIESPELINSIKHKKCLIDLSFLFEMSRMLTREIHCNTTVTIWPLVLPFLSS